MLNVLLRDKYFAYAVSIGLGGALFYLYSIGQNHWLYNPLAYRLWSYADLTSGNLTTTWFAGSIGLGSAQVVCCWRIFVTDRRYARLRRAASTI